MASSSAPSEPLDPMKGSAAITPGQARTRSRLAKVRVVLWALVLVTAGAMAVGMWMKGRGPSEPEIRMALPAFSLVDQRGQRFGLEQLRGKIWVADFVFTTCPTVCPKLTKRMVEIQEKTKDLKGPVHLLTITVDPENDTPEVLARYAEQYGASPARWTFLTGPLAEIEPTVVKGFKTAMGKKDEGGGLMSIFHGEHLVLVDREGMIRGFYPADDEGIAKLLRDVEALGGAS